MSFFGGTSTSSSTTSTGSGGTSSTANNAAIATPLINQFGALLILLVCSALIAFIPLSLLHFIYRKKRRRIRDQEYLQNQYQHHNHQNLSNGKYHNAHCRNGGPKPIPNVNFPDDDEGDDDELPTIDQTRIHQGKKSAQKKPKKSLFRFGWLLGGGGDSGSHNQQSYTNRHCHVASSLHHVSEMALASTLAIPNMLLELIRSLDGGLLLAALFLILIPQLRSSFDSFMRAHVYTTKLRLPTSMKIVNPLDSSLYESNSTIDLSHQQSQSHSINHNLTNILTRQIASIQRHNEQQDANQIKQTSPIPLVELILCLAFFALHFIEEFVQLCLRYPKYFWACNSSIVYSSSDGTCEFTSLDYRISRTKRYLIDCSRKTSSQSSPRASTPSSSINNQKQNQLFDHSENLNPYHSNTHFRQQVNNNNNRHSGAPSADDNNDKYQKESNNNNNNSDDDNDNSDTTRNTQFVNSVNESADNLADSDPSQNQQQQPDQSLPLPPPPLPPPNRYTLHNQQHHTNDPNYHPQQQQQQENDETDIVCDHHQLDDSLQSVDNSELFQPNYRHSQQQQQQQQQLYHLQHQPQCQFHHSTVYNQQHLTNAELFQQNQHHQPIQNDREPGSMLSNCSSIHLPSYYWQQMPTNTVPLSGPNNVSGPVPQLFSSPPATSNVGQFHSHFHPRYHPHSKQHQQQQYALRKTPLPYFCNPADDSPDHHLLNHQHHPGCPIAAILNSENSNPKDGDTVNNNNDNKPELSEGANADVSAGDNEYPSSMPPPPTPLSEALADYQHHPPSPPPSPPPPPQSRHYHPYHGGVPLPTCCCKHQHYDPFGFQYVGPYGPNHVSSHLPKSSNLPQHHHAGMPLFAFGSNGGGSGGVGSHSSPASNSSSSTTSSSTPIFTKIFLPYTTIATSTPALYLCEGVLIAIQPTSSMLWLMLSVILLHKLVTGLLVAFELHEKTTGNQRHLPAPTAILFVALPTLGYLSVMILNGIVILRKHQPLITSTSTINAQSTTSSLLSVSVDPLSVETAVIKVILFAIASATLLHLVLLIIQRNLIQFQPQLQLRKQQQSQQSHHTQQQQRKFYTPFRGAQGVRHQSVPFSVPMAAFSASAANSNNTNTSTTGASSDMSSSTSTVESGSCRKSSHEHLYPSRPEETTVYDPEIVTNPPRHGVLHHFTMYTGFIVVLMAVAFLNMANLNKV